MIERLQNLEDINETNLADGQEYEIFDATQMSDGELSALVGLGFLHPEAGVRYAVRSEIRRRAELKVPSDRL